MDRLCRRFFLLFLAYLGTDLPMVKVVTINILFGPESWGERRQLLTDGLLAEQPDCVLAQEVWEAAGEGDVTENARRLRP
jgi:hypothetical protein